MRNEYLITDWTQENIFGNDIAFEGFRLILKEPITEERLNKIKKCHNFDMNILKGLTHILYETDEFNITENNLKEECTINKANILINALLDCLAEDLTYQRKINTLRHQNELNTRIKEMGL
jgi:hypothetical protein